MKILLSLLTTCVLLCCTLSGCSANNVSYFASSSSASATISEADSAEVMRVVDALAGAQLIGGSSWEKIEDESFAYNLALTTFYCIMNPGYPTEIPAEKYEAFMKSYLNVSVEFLREMQDYDAAQNVYIVSHDVSVDRAMSNKEDYYRIGNMELTSDGMIKVPYRIIWGQMAESADENDTVFAGYALLEPNDGVFRTSSVQVTEDNTEKYDG